MRTSRSVLRAAGGETPRPTLPHSWGKSLKGKDVVRKTTAKSRFARSLAAVKAWCRTNRHRPAGEQRAWLSAVLNGHYAYYGITGNIRRLQEYRYQVVRTWHKWLERRTRGRSFNGKTRRPPNLRGRFPSVTGPDGGQRRICHHLGSRVVTTGPASPKSWNARAR